jgi:Zn finger protein HypA/HybF involved in hydrogenase expression
MLTVMKEVGTRATNGKSRMYLLVKCSECSKEFEKTLSDYTRNPDGHCIKCSNTKSGETRLKKASNKFVRAATLKHNNRYSYANVVYLGAKSKVTIKCAKHGSFLMTPNSHLNGQGCPKCGKEAMAIAQSAQARAAFCSKAADVHKKKYSYSSPLDYKNANTPIPIECPIHGTFTQRPTDHLNGHGCPRCKVGSDMDVLYIWKVTNTQDYKIGITSNRLNDKRIVEVATALGVAFEIKVMVACSNAKYVEKQIHSKFTKIPVQPYVCNGYTEFRTLTDSDLKEALALVDTLKIP